MGQGGPQSGDPGSGLFGRLWQGLRRHGLGYSLGLLVIGGIGGVLFWGAFNWAIAYTNTEEFCISCHEMRSTVYEELKETIHYKNPDGVRAICSDCHVPKEWFPKIQRKIAATFDELPNHLLGKIDTKEKFEDHRLEMAKDVWASMEANDSRECRNCHELESMDFEAQEQRAATQHKDSLETGETCIDCHKGIAHKDVSDQLEQPAEEGGFMLE